MTFELRQIEIGARSLSQRGFGVMENVKSEIEKPACHRLAVDFHMRFKKVPAAWPNHENRRLAFEGIGLAAVGIGEIELSFPAVLEIDLPLQKIVPGRRVGILEIRH